MKGDILLGLVIIFLTIISFNFGYVDKAVICNREKGQYCNNYEIEKMVNIYGTGIKRQN